MSTYEECDPSKKDVNEKHKQIGKIPEPGRCNFYVARKFRYCKMLVRKDEKYCGEHQSPESFNSDDNVMRVPCPLDNKHSCYAHLLNKHLRKCNARRQNVPEYIVPDINRGIDCDESSVKLTLSSVQNDFISRLIEKINGIDLPVVHTEVHFHSALKGNLSDDQYGSSTRKHFLQNSSLLGHLQKLNLLKSENCFIEFGAGRGQLSYWIGLAMSQQGKPCLLVPIDRSSNRHKFDSKHRGEELIKILRLRVDIADLCLENVPEVRERKSIVAVCKHLCGDATDLALRCLISSKLNITGIIMAPCCHHRIKWNSYVGQDFLQECMINREEFIVMSCLASWATCGQHNFNRGTKPTERLDNLNLRPQECEEIGRRCKLLFDYGRLQFLEKHGFKCKMVYYTEKDVSPENICMISSLN